MGKFYPLFVRRSDGKLETLSKGKREANAPSKDQLDQSPDKNGVSDYYREIPLNETKHLDWRRKLGGMLAREMDPKEKVATGNGFILADFPEYYRLYEHVKRTEKDGKTEVKSKTHAAGGNDRQDAYLYGHPAGKRKRFRSPGDFFPHLLWLCTDETGDPNNCTCKLCSPEDLENAIPGAKPRLERDEKAYGDKIEVTEDSSQDNVQVGKAVPVIPQRRISEQSTQQTPQPVAAASRSTSTAQRGSAPLPPAMTNNQQLDRQYRGLMYRPGELVWFQRGHAWGLGIVLRRWLTAQRQHNYLVQPLSYPGHMQSPQHKTSDAEMRPWLAWSVPKYTNDDLNGLAFTYDDADWQGILNRRYGQGDVEVDASILAAKSIDSSYTMTDLFETSEVEPGVVERHYRSAFVGAEKIWLGEPVRLIGGSNTDVMVVHQIVEKVRAAVPSRVTYLVGDVYRLGPSSLPNPAAPANNLHLPQRMNEDLAMRNARSMSVKQITSSWNVVALQVKVDVDQIKGRWYEATILLPILLAAQFETMSSKGDIPEASLWMNARGDCLNSNRASELPRIPRQSFRKETRREALSRAVPPAAELYDGVEPPTSRTPGNSVPTAMDIDSRFDSTSNAAGTNMHNTHGANDFVDLTQMDNTGTSASVANRPYGGDSNHGPRGYY